MATNEPEIIESEHDYIHEDLIVDVAELLRKKKEAPPELVPIYQRSIDNLKEWIRVYLNEWHEDVEKEGLEKKKDEQR